MSRNSEPQIVGHLVGRYYKAAKTAMKNSADMDKKVTEAAIAKRESVEVRADTIGGWISRYSAARAPGGKGISRKVATAAIRYFDDVRREPATRKQIALRFDELRSIVGDAYGERAGAERKYLVVTSKLLWTRFPTTAPIYDRLAVRSITFLVKVLKAELRSDVYAEDEEEALYHKKKSDILWSNAYRTKRERDGWDFRDFHQSHEVIYRLFEAPIKERLGGARTNAFRLFDKLLWILGNEDRDYSLKGHGF